MNFTANTRRHRISGLVHRGSLAVGQKSFPRPRTARIERFFLIAIIVLVSQDRSLIAGFSLSSVVFFMCGVYVLLRRPRPLARVLSDRLFVTVYILLGLASLIEFFHPAASYSEIFRITQMFVGAIIIASLCRDRSALRAAMHGYLIAGVWLSAQLFLTSFGVLGGATATDFEEASRLRQEVFKDASVYFSSLVSINAAVVALASTLTARAPHRRYLYLTIAVFCAIAGSLTLSRSAVIMLIGSLATVVFASGVKRGRTIFIVAVTGAAIFMLIPDVVWSRFTLQMDTQRGHHEARVRLYIAAMENLPDYVMTGVGAGNFWGAWGRQTNFHVGTQSVSGAHNVFLQVIIYWGLPALLTLIAVVWQAYRCFPRRCGADVLSLQLLGVSVAALIMSFSMHSLYAKDFSLVLGLLVGARCWVWPRGGLQTATRKRRLPRPSLRAWATSARMRPRLPG
jgi:hypothetical protein